MNKIYWNIIIKSNFFFFLLTIPLSIILLYLLNKVVIDGYIFNDFIGGWDGSGHYAIAKQYSENVFPAFWGWIPHWYNGMPFPQFYPPLFYYIVALLDHITPIDFSTLFKTIILAAPAVTPTIVALVYYYRINRSKIQSLFVLLLSIVLLSAKSRIGFIGVSMSSILNNGLVTQPLAFVFLLLWLLFFLSIHQKPIHKYYAGFFLFLILLSNVHVTLVTLCLFIYICVYRTIQVRQQWKDYKYMLVHCLTYLLSGLIPLLVAAFWYIPMLSYYDNFVGQSFGWKWGTLSNLYYYHYYFPIFILIGAIVSLWKRQILVSAVTTITIVVNIFFYTKIYEFVPTLPFHIDRWLGTLYFLLPLVIVYVFTELKTILKNQLLFYVLVISLVGYTAYSTISIGVFRDDLRGIYVDGVTEHIQPILAYMKDKDGLVLVEWYTPYEKPLTALVDAYLGVQGNRTTYSIIRESSLSSLFWVPVRNSLSAWPECWGIKCNLAFDPEYLDNTIAGQLKVANSMGVEYLIIRSREQKDLLDNTVLVTKEKDFGDWTVYKMKNKPVIASVPQKEPVLVFSALYTKEKSERRFDFLSLVEEINLKRARTDFVFAYAGNQNLDQNDDINRFNYLLLDHYVYQDLYTAIEQITKYVQTKKIIALPADDDLYRYIKLYAETTQTNNIVLLDDLPAEEFEKHYNATVARIDAFVSSRKKDGAVVLGQQINDSVLHISLQQNKQQEIPIRIAASYFPSWEAVDGQKLYLAGPAQYLLFTDNSTTLQFNTPSEVTTGHVVAIMGLVATLCCLIINILTTKLHAKD